MSTSSRRPVGVLVVVLVLGLFAAIALAFAGLFGVVGMTYHVPAAAGQPMPPSGLFKAIAAGLVVLFLMLAAWMAVTLFGLLGLHRWARYSVLVLGGVMTFFSVMAIFGAVVSAMVVPQIAAGSPLPVHTLQMVYLFTGLLYSLVAGVGVWWLVYFNLRSVRAAFAPDPYAEFFAPPVGSTLTGAPPPPPVGNVRGYPIGNARVDARGPQPPALIVVLACLFLLGALLTVGAALLPFPAFLFGLLISGTAKNLLYAVLAVLSAAIGVGLLRLDNRARLATYALLVLGSVNLILITLPSYQQKLLAYNDQLTASMGLPASPAALSLLHHPGFLAVSVIPGLVVYGLIFWVLHHYRRCFLPRVDPAQAAAR